MTQKTPLYTIAESLYRGREIRTPASGFGDRHSTIKLCPYVIKLSLIAVFQPTKTIIHMHLLFVNCFF